MDIETPLDRSRSLPNIRQVGSHLHEAASCLGTTLRTFASSTRANCEYYAPIIRERASSTVNTIHNFGKGLINRSQTVPDLRQNAHNISDAVQNWVWTAMDKVATFWEEVAPNRDAELHDS